MSTSTKRPFRVSRYSSGGTTWGAWTHTYHADFYSALAAANRFLQGAGRYAGVNIGVGANDPRTHRAEVLIRSESDWKPVGVVRKNEKGTYFEDATK